jgi:hypothetical protein
METLTRTTAFCEVSGTMTGSHQHQQQQQQQHLKQQQLADHARSTYNGGIANGSMYACTSQVQPAITKTSPIMTRRLSTTTANTKAGRLKDLQLMEFYLNQNRVAEENGTTESSGDVSVNESHDNPLFRSTEILTQHILRPEDTNEVDDDDDRLISQILFHSMDITAHSNHQLLQRHPPFGDTTKTFSFSIPKMSSHSQNGIVTMAHGTALDVTSNNNNISIFNSSAWKPALQSDHQEISYAPDSIFETSAVAGSTAGSTTTNHSTLPTNHTTGNSMVSSPTGKVNSLSVGAESLLLAAQVLHDENHDNPIEYSYHTENTNDLEKKPRATKGRNDDSTIQKGHSIPILTNYDTSIHEKEIHAATQAIVSSIGRQQIPLELIRDSEITNNDVLLGRGGRTNHHEGNATYRQHKEAMQERYLKATKDEKTIIANELVQMIHSRDGRFLKEYDPNQSSEMNKNDDETGNSRKRKKSKKKRGNDYVVEYWYEVDLLTARRKASQALREINTPENRAAKRVKYSKK